MTDYSDQPKKRQRSWWKLVLNSQNTVLKHKTTDSFYGLQMPCKDSLNSEILRVRSQCANPQPKIKGSPSLYSLPCFKYYLFHKKQLSDIYLRISVLKKKNPWPTADYIFSRWQHWAMPFFATRPDNKQLIKETASNTGRSSNHFCPHLKRSISLKNSIWNNSHC